jgi:hypothetical protein
MNLSPKVKVTVLNSYVAGSQNTLNTNGVDMSGYEGVMFLAIFGTVTNTGVATVKAQVSDTSASAGFADPASGAISGQATASGTAVILDVYRPLHRWVNITIGIATANVAIDAVIAIQYGAKSMPTVQDATTIATTVLAADAK